MSSEGSTLDITVAHRGTAYPLSLLPDSTLDALQARLEELTSVPPELQKLLYKGKKAPSRSDDGAPALLKDVGIKDGMKIQMLGSTPQEVGNLSAVENEQKRRERIMRERALKASTKVRTSGSSSSSSASLQFRFHNLAPLPHLPAPETALALLNRLSTDPAIKHVMQKHEFAVGLLTELAPHEHPQLLGLNENRGQTIKLRLRTDIYDGFRTYKEVRRVLCHELTHNVHSDHDNKFKELNSQLNREVAEFERTEREGTHHLHGYTGRMYDPDSALEAEAHSHVLGSDQGSSARGGSSSTIDSQEERRRRALEAAIGRLRKEEEELESRCGTAGPSAKT